MSKKVKKRELFVSKKVYKVEDAWPSDFDKDYAKWDAQEFEYDVLENGTILPVITSIKIDYGFDEIERMYVLRLRI